MPADPSKTGSSSRRSFRKLSTEEEIDVRRARGEISCAECRRLKLKCDKKLPCSSCVRRGCQSICPNGSLSTGQGTRFVLADTEQLHHKISEMGQRIRQLEDALAIFQAGVSNESHPLLREELLSIKFGPEVHGRPEVPQTSQDPSGQSMDALGTLAIGNRGVKYFGRSAGSETLFLAGAELEPTVCEEEDLPSVPSNISRLSNLFPFVAGGIWDCEKSLDILYPFLPPQPRAWSLCETYIEHACWSFRPIKRDEIVDEILTPIYKAAKEKENPDFVESSSISPHKMAVLYIMFALGALVDLTLPPNNTEAETYFQLGRAALALRSVFDSPEIATVQAIVLMAAYHSLAGRRYSMDSAWSLVSLGAKLAQSIGLHRDSARWNLDPKTVQRRRWLFWELFSTDLFHSLALGRPPSIRLSYIDCEFPEDTEQTLDKNGQPEIGFYAWKYRFTRDIFSLVIELTLTAAPPKYETILDLDRKVRERVLPSSLNIFRGPEDEYCSPSIYMRGCLLSQYRSVTMMYIHRSFFAQAMLDHPVNPLRSHYAPSFLAAYRCASVVIKSNTNHFERYEDLMIRWGSNWGHLFSAAIIVGSIVTRAPSSSMAPSAFIELGLAVDLFQKGAKFSGRARSALAILSRLREKALQVYAHFRSGNTPPNSDLRLNPKYEEDGEDELAIFGGQTRVLVSRLVTKKPSSKRPKSVSSPVPSSTPASSSSGDMGKMDSPSSMDVIPDIHPSLMEYLSLFPSSTFPTSSSSSQSIACSATDSMEQLSRPMQPTSDLLPSPSTSFQPSSHQPFSAQDFSKCDLGAPSPFFTSLQHPDFAEMSTPTAMAVNGNTDFPPPGNLMDLGMMMSGESGMDEQWVSFIQDMRQSGFLDPADFKGASSS